MGYPSRGITSVSSFFPFGLLQCLCPHWVSGQDCCPSPPKLGVPPTPQGFSWGVQALARATSGGGDPTVTLHLLPAPGTRNSSLEGPVETTDEHTFGVRRRSAVWDGGTRVGQIPWGQRHPHRVGREVYDGDGGRALSASVASPGACNHLTGLFPPHGLRKGTWWDLGPSLVLAATRSRWLWRWLCSPASPSPSCSSCSTSAGAAPSLALTVSAPSLVTRSRGCDVGTALSPRPWGRGHLGWATGVWEEGLWVGGHPWRGAGSPGSVGSSC